MPGITLDQLAEQEAGSSTPEIGVIGETFDEQPKQESRANEMFSRVLTAETGDGSIGDYLDHPMNFNNSKGLAQILRGFTGIVGNLNLAVIDVLFGLLRFSREKKGVMNNDVSIRGNLPS